MDKFSILLVDDIEENIYALKLIIEDSFDIDIHSALSAQEAMPILMDNDIDLVLSDIQMPEIDGFQFAEYIKGIEKTKDIPIIFITGIYDKDEYKKKGFDLGAIEYISKPIDDNLLTAKLKVYIDLYESSKQTKEEMDKQSEIMIHQSKMATMGEMIGVISHQLKQPLNVLSLYCNSVKESHTYNEIDDEFIEKFQTDTQDQINFMTETIDSFREFFDPHKHKTTFTLKSSFEKSFSLLDKQMENNNIKINATIGDEVVYGVESELQQVFLNLITNSKDAFIDRKIENRQIYITTLHKDSYSIVMYEDNAGGIKEEQISKIFDPYFTTKEYGTGTGLYMVKLVIQNSFSGKLKIQNTQKGLKYIIVLNSKKT